MELRSVLGLIFGFLLNVSTGQEQFHREIKPSSSHRLQRQIPIGAYPISLNQHYAAAAVQDGSQAAQNTQLFLQHLASPQSPLTPQHFQYVQQPQVQAISAGNSHQVQQLTQYTPSQNGGLFLDQFGGLVQVGQAQPQKVQQTVSHSAAPNSNSNILRLVDQYGNVVGQIQAPSPVQVQQVQTPVAPVYQQIVSHSPVFHQVVQPAPVLHQVVQPAPVLHQVVQPAPVYQEIVQPAPVYQEIVQPAPVYQEVVQPAPVYHHQVLAPPPVPVVHEIAKPAAVVQKTELVPPPAGEVELPAAPKYLPPPPPPAQAVPVVPVVHKTVVEAAPELHIIKQPILPPAVFQKEIFAIKSPPVRVLTYSDLCTVYPYQRKLKACVIKKGQLPELHHPDIQLVSGTDPTSTVKSTTSATNGGDSSSPADGNIQDILRRKNTETFIGLDPNDEEPFPNGEQGDEQLKKSESLSAASSNQKEKLKKLRISRITTKRTTTTTTTTEAPETTTKKPRRKSTKGRRNRNKKNSTTTEKPFVLT